MDTTSCASTGEHITWLPSDGEDVCRFEYRLTPGRRWRHAGWLPHVHPNQHEAFTVLGGEAVFRVAGRRQTATSGAEVAVPPATGHRFWNAGTEDLHMRIELRPALRVRELFEVSFAVADLHPVLAAGIPRDPLLAGVLGHEYLDEIVLLPVRLQRLVLPRLAALGRRLGRELPEPPSGA